MLFPIGLTYRYDEVLAGFHQLLATKPVPTQRSLLGGLAMLQPTARKTWTREIGARISMGACAPGSQALAEGGDAKAQLAMWFATNISGKERAAWLHRAADQGYLDARLYSGLVFVEEVCRQNDKAELEVGKDTAIRHLKMPPASGSATAQHAVSMLMYCFDCDSGSKAEFLDATRYIRKAARQGLDVVGLYRLNPCGSNSLKAPGLNP